MYTLPLRRTILHLGQRFFTEDDTFISFPLHCSQLGKNLRLILGYGDGMLEVG